MEISGFSDVDCTQHELQFCEINELYNRHDTKINIANHFNHLTIIQERLKRSKLTVFHDCITRWNSSFYMIFTVIIITTKYQPFQVKSGKLWKTMLVYCERLKKVHEN